MQVPGIEHVVAGVRSAPGVRHGAGATEEEVAEAESALGLRLPEGYRGFVRSVGWAVLGSLELLGRGADAPGELDVARATEEARATGLPTNAVVVARDPSTAGFCLDATHAGPYESPVSRWVPEAGPGQLGYVAHDFASWLWMRLAEQGLV